MEVPDRERPMAGARPSATDVMADLVASGVVISPTIAGPMSMPTIPAEPESEVGDLLSALREEERW
jgi:hypothetical protein